MKVIIAGSREGVTYKDVCEAMSHASMHFFAMKRFDGKVISQVLCGNADGADLLGKSWAESVGIKVREFDPDWEDVSSPDAVIMYHKDGRPYNAKAGHDRNQVMVDIADAAVFVRKMGKSRGTDDCIRRCKKKGIPYYIHQL